jgi:hypothetical protein
MTGLALSDIDRALRKVQQQEMNAEEGAALRLLAVMIGLYMRDVVWLPLQQNLHVQIVLDALAASHVERWY